MWGIAVWLLGALLLGGCGSARLVATQHADGAGAVPAWALVGYGREIREQFVIDPRTGETTASASASWTLENDGSGEDQRWTVRSTETDIESGKTAVLATSGQIVGPYGTVFLAWSRSVKATDPDGPVRLFAFEPPLIWFPGSIEPGLVFEARTKLTERDPRDESRVVLTGKAIRRVAIVDRDSPGWPFGERTGRAVAAELRIKVGPAIAVRRRTIMIDPDGTSGDEFVEFSVRVLGIPVKRERTLYRNME